MSTYRLPCSCGRTLSVTARQAGQTVTCSCGAQLEVPTLRGLRDLPPGDGPDDEQSWENRQRVIFSLALISLAAFVLAGYLWMRLPVVPVYTTEQFQYTIDIAPPDALFDLLHSFERGLVDPRSPPREDRGEFMKLGIGISAAIGLASAIAAIMTSIRGRQAAKPVGPVQETKR